MLLFKPKLGGLRFIPFPRGISLKVNVIVQLGFELTMVLESSMLITIPYQNKAREHKRELYITFVDLAKTFDTMSYDGLWSDLGKLVFLKKCWMLSHHFIKEYTHQFR